MTDKFLAICENFKFQSAICKSMGSRFYADLLLELEDIIAQSTDLALIEVFSSWPGTPRDDAIALRFIAALNYLVITNADSKLCAIFPPTLSLEGSARTNALADSIERHQNFIIDYIRSPPQTNEVGRSIVLLGGFLELAKRFGSALDIFEIGASAGLNMSFDKYFYQCPAWRWGDPKSGVHLKPNWQGNPPPLGPVNIHQRKACDISPINADTEKNRLLSYVWPDQIERAQRIQRAIDYATISEPQIDAIEASEWLLERSQETPQRPRVFYHSIIWQYFTKQQQQAFSTTMEKMGREATESTALIWMRLEPARHKQHAELKITTWPNKVEEHLANSGYHGEWVRWLST